MRITHQLAAVGLVTALAAVSGCSGGGDSTTRELTPVQRLAAAKTTLDQASSVHLTLSSQGLPSGASGVTAADGVGVHPPAFKGTFKVTLRGIPADAELTSVGGEVWAKLPLVPGTTKIDPKTFGIPDPAVLFSPDKGLTNLLPQTQGPTAGKQTRQGSEVLTPISGALPGRAVSDLFMMGDPNGTFQATYALTDANQLRDVTLTGPFFGAGSTSTYTLTLDQYNKPVTITKP